jgi:hypothetical protein
MDPVSSKPSASFERGRRRKRMGGAFLACGFNNRLLSGSGVQAANTQGSMTPFGPWRRTQPLHRPLRRQRTAGMPMAAGTIQKRRQETPLDTTGHESTAVICWPWEPPPVGTLGRGW